MLYDYFVDVSNYTGLDTVSRCEALHREMGQHTAVWNVVLSSPV